MKTFPHKLFAALCLTALAGASLATAQDSQNTTIVESRPTPVGLPDPAPFRVQHHRSTELGDALDAYSNVIEAQGRAAVNRSLAVNNYQYAEQQRLQNIVSRERAKVEIERQRLELQTLRYELQDLQRKQAELYQSRKKPTAIVTNRGHIQWIEPLRAKAFAEQRAAIEDNVIALKMSTSLKDREESLDAINQSCQELVTAIEEQPGLAPAAADSSRRFVMRLYDDLQSPTTQGSGMHLTSVR